MIGLGRTRCQSERWYTFEDLSQQVRELHPRPAFDDPTIKLGLYLTQDLNVLSGRQMNPPDDTEVVKFQISEGIIANLFGAADTIKSQSS
jgi:hypothetical protein